MLSGLSTVALKVKSNKPVFIAVTGCRVLKAKLEVQNLVFDIVRPGEPVNGITKLEFFQGEPFHADLACCVDANVIIKTNEIIATPKLILTETERANFDITFNVFIQPINFTDANIGIKCRRAPICAATCGGKSNAIVYDGLACIMKFV